MTSWKRLFVWIASVSALYSQPELQIYLVDVEGGAATLIVTPQREAILIDTGWRREDGRDAKRIHEVATRLAGLKQIDYLVTTHYHRDHYGGVARLAQMIPIVNFLDHGPMTALEEDPQFSLLYTGYLRASRGERRKIKPGDEIPLKPGRFPVQLLCVASNGETISGEGDPNPVCSKLKPAQDDLSDNARSVSLLLRYGDFEYLNCGDLTWNIEARLVCPVNLIGQIDAFQVTHHGLKISNNPVLLQSIEPTVALMNNGSRKGGQREVFALLKSLNSSKDLFQVHLNLDTRAEDNTSPELIANLESEENCAGHWMRLSVSPDGSMFTVTNSRNNLTRSYSVK